MIYLEDDVLWGAVHLDPLKHAEVTPGRLLESFYAIQVFFVDLLKSHFDSCSSLPSVLVAVGSQITRSGQRLKWMTSVIRDIIQVFGYVPNSKQGALV